MNWKQVEDYFRDKLLAEENGSGTFAAGNIALPNRMFQHENRDIWIELSVSNGNQYARTERTRVYQAIINIVVCVRLNTGTQRAYKISERITSLFSCQDYTRGVFIMDPSHKIYVRDIEQMPNIAANEVNKTGVRVSIDIYEEDV